ncbi:MAG: hypothetical protein RLZZ324_280, partial [Candidatus Parcubacteria bacterium]
GGETEQEVMHVGMINRNEAACMIPRGAAPANALATAELSVRIDAHRQWC